MYTILTDSCSDLNPEILCQFDHVTVLPMSYTLSGETSTKAFDDAQTVRAYYDRLRAGESCTTAQISPETFYQTFKGFAERGEAVLGILFSSALSGTFNAACLARSLVLEEYPDAEIELVDSLSASAGEGLLVYDALKNREAGMSLFTAGDFNPRLPRGRRRAPPRVRTGRTHFNPRLPRGRRP